MDKIDINESKNIKIFNRFESKYILEDIEYFISLLENDYLLVTDNEKYKFKYHSLYFDTTDLDMWNDHEIDKSVRQKIRIREYDDNTKYLEIKEKNNDYTIKSRIPVMSYEIGNEKNWISENLKYNTKELKRSLDIYYDRISFIKKDKSERITIDTNLRCFNYSSDKEWKYNNFIAEIKKEHLENNKIENILNNKGIFKQKFSKYHEGIKNTR